MTQWILFYIYWLISIGDMSIEYANLSCGIDGSYVSTPYQGEVDIKIYPWMGLLFYPVRKTLWNTVVVLVTRQMVIGAAVEIDRLPKFDFRSRARVVIGQKCSSGAIRVRDYNYHPDYLKNSVSALVIIQLEIDNVKQELHPICPPPDHFIDPAFYAMSLSDSCSRPRVKIHRMQYIPVKRCVDYYRRTELNEESLWPTHTACARAISREKCVWRSGTVLTVKHDGRWRLLGLSIYGPGCGAPSRFLDYGKYHGWVRRSASTVGAPSITRLADNQIIVRKAPSNVQRFGPCDREEINNLIYSDQVQLKSRGSVIRSVYNVTLYSDIEYTCVTFHAVPEEKVRLVFERPLNLKFHPEVDHTLPKIHLRRWCAGPPQMCYGFQLIDISFHVIIQFQGLVYFNMRAYGKEPTVIDPAAAMKMGQEAPRPSIPTYRDIMLQLSNSTNYNYTYKWFP